MTNETIKSIRAALKAAGYNRNQVSVAKGVDITVRCSKVNLAKVEEIAKAHRHVEICQYSGDTFAGGTYVTVHFAKGVREGVVGVDTLAYDIDRMHPGDSMVFRDWKVYPSNDMPGDFEAAHPSLERDIETFGGRTMAYRIAEQEMRLDRVG